MTYCLAIKVDGGVAFAADSRTHASRRYASIQNQWAEGIRNAFTLLPRFAWE